MAREKVYGCQISVMIHADFVDIAERSELSVDQVRQMWDNEQLGDLLEESFNINEILDFANGSVTMEIGSGYY